MILNLRKPDKRPMKAKINPVHVSYAPRNRPPMTAKEKCRSCNLIAIAVSVGLIAAMIVIWFS